MPLQTAYKIVSHFKFEVGAAVASSQKLESSLGRLSNQVKGINDQFKILFASTALQLTGGQAGIIGFLKNATSASNDFYTAQRKLATVLTGNAKFFKNPIENFNKNMKISKDILTDMVKEANKFGIGVNNFIGTFNALNPFLIPKGAAGENFQETRKMSRNLLLGSTLFGLTPDQARFQLQTLIQGNLGNPNQSLWSALRQEAPEVFGRMTPRGFNALKMSNRVEKINKAFDKFMGKSGVMAAHLDDVSTQMKILNNLFLSMGSVLKPVGDVLRRPILDALKRINQFLMTQFLESMEILARAIKPFVQDLDALEVTFRKLASLGGSYNLSKQFSGLLFVIVELRKHIPWVAKQFTKIGVAASGGLIATLGQVLKWIFKTDTVLKAFGKTLKFIVAGIASYLKFFIPLFTLLRVVDSAKAHAKVEDRKMFETHAALLANKLSTVKETIITIIAPFTYLIDLMGKMISPLFQVSYWIEKVHGFINKLNLQEFFTEVSRGFIFFFATVQAGLSLLGNLAKEFLKTITPGTGQFMQFSKMKENMGGIVQNSEDFIKFNRDRHLANFDKFLETQLEKAGKPQTINNIGKVEIRNQFRENLEPDRIAVTIKETLLNAVQNPIDTISRDQVFTPGVGG